MAKNTQASEPILAFQDDVSIQQHETLIHTLHLHLAAAVDQFNSFGIGGIETNELRAFAEDHTGFVKDRCLSLINDTPAVGQFKMKKESLVNQLELPDLSEIEKHLHEVKKTLTKFNRFLVHLIKFFTVVDGKVEINQSEFQALLEGAKTYAVTDKEKEMWKAYKAFVDAWNALDTLAVQHEVSPNGIKSLRPDRFITIKGDNTIDINPVFYNTLVHKNF